MENQPNTENISYIDEYPDLAKRVWLRRLAQQRLAKVAIIYCDVLPFPKPPDGAA